ncbi:MAG: LysM peptidoglycan-binding domain-containing protein [Kiritimatiellales bacterium]|nr:LysM peptidoglycan-binding domain-containing protein [Kiritimatiellales bacterium]MCF7863477.1 LysM peptidoglycan-binding domain-containing protein [Kiritimatiellales bacterium]
MKIKLLFMLPLVGILSGCETFQTPQQRQQAAARQQNAARVAEERLYRLQGKVESLEMANAQLSQDVQQLQSDVRALNSQLSQLGSGIQSLESRQARDKQEVINQVSGRVESLLQKQAAATPAKPSGREHVVEAGHTLSAIASAYGTTVKAIKQANNLKSDQIYVGQKLFIPE